MLGVCHPSASSRRLSWRDGVRSLPAHDVPSSRVASGSARAGTDLADIAEVGVGDLRGGERIQLGPHAGGPGARVRLIRFNVARSARPTPATRSRPTQPGPAPGLVTQHVNVRDHLTSIGSEHGDVDRDPASVMSPAKRRAR